MLLVAALFMAVKSNSQVGIGTNTPSTNSALDINSSTKGLMLPRLADTSSVTNPSAGLLIYNAHTKTPAFHNGSQWNALTTGTSTTTPAPDSVSYTISGSSNGFTAGSFKVLNWSHGLSTSGGPAANWQDVHFTKPIDANSIAFSKAVAAGTTQGMYLEIKVFSADSTTPRFSMKFTTFKVSSYSVGSSDDPTSLVEEVSLTAQIVGFKNWITNTSYAWNISTNVATGY